MSYSEKKSDNLSGQTSNNAINHDSNQQKEQSSGSIFTNPTPGVNQKTVATMFGEVVWLFTQSPKHKNFFLFDLEWLVMTPIMLQQFRVFYAPDRPIGVALWAFVNEAVEKRLMSGNARLAPNDWKSGDRLWLVDIVAPYGGQDEMIKDLKEKVFPNQEIKFLAVAEGNATAKKI